MTSCMAIKTVDRQGDATHAAVPTCLFGILCLLDAVVIYACLPDTSCGSMPDTIADVEDDVSEQTSESEVRSRC